MDVEKVTEVAPAADDDGRLRTGTVWTATTHAITAIIGSGVLALPWSVAQMGWILGPIALVGCAYITYFTAVLLSDCYRSPDPVHGKRNYTYMDAVRSCLVRDPLGRDSGLHHHSSHGHHVRGAQQLPPLQGPWRGLQPGRDDVPRAVRPRGGGALPAAEPGEGHLHLHRGGRHVLHLLLRRALPQRHQVRHQPQGLRHHPRQQDRRNRRRLGPDTDLELPAGPRQHCLRLHLLHAPHRNPGHREVPAVGERDDEEGEPVRHRRDHRILRVARVHRVRGVRQRRAGEHPHRLRRALLAHRPRQHRRRHPPRRRLPGVRAARVRVLREVAAQPVPGVGLLPPRVRAAAARRTRDAVHHVQAGAAHGVRGHHHNRLAHAALLQRHPGAARRRRVLAAHRVLPGHHVHHAGQGAARQPQVARAAGAQRRRAPRVAARRGGVRGGHRPAPRTRHHVQDPAVIDRSIDRRRQLMRF